MAELCRRERGSRLVEVYAEEETRMDRKCSTARSFRIPCAVARSPVAGDHWLSLHVVNPAIHEEGISTWVVQNAGGHIDLGLRVL
jgi:hypothetical protein